MASSELSEMNNNKKKKKKELIVDIFQFSNFSPQQCSLPVPPASSFLSLSSGYYYITNNSPVDGIGGLAGLPNTHVDTTMKQDVSTRSFQCTPPLTPTILPLLHPQTSSPLPPWRRNGVGEKAMSSATEWGSKPSHRLDPVVTGQPGDTVSGFKVDTSYIGG